MDEKTPFYTMTPDRVIDAVESEGWLSDYRILALNSYENRVYQVGVDQAEPVIAKFYRPGRWTDAQILEEHAFCFELAQADISVVAPLCNEQQQSLLLFDQFRFALFARRGGRAPELDDPEHLYQLGVALGQIHAVGAQKSYQERPVLDAKSYGWQSRELILQHHIPTSLRPAYESISQELLERVDQRLADYSDVTHIRVHGDCHGGNVLWRDDRPHFVDFDDSRMAPAIQDLWMLLTGERYQQEMQLGEVIAGYEEFNRFNPRELNLIESYRILRMMNHAAWIARRWEDPAFPMAFPWFNTERYWGEHLLDLKMQVSALDEPVLKLL